MPAEGPSTISEEPPPFSNFQGYASTRRQYTRFLGDLKMPDITPAEHFRLCFCYSIQAGRGKAHATVNLNVYTILS